MTMPLDEIEALLQAGLRRSMQGSLGRRRPNGAALPALSTARAQLRTHVERAPQDARAWRLLALAEEALLAYPRAIAALERAVAIDGTRDKRDLKRLAALKETHAQWQQLRLTPDELHELGVYLEAQLANDPALTDELGWTRAWLQERFAASDVNAILAAFADRDSWTDEDVLENVVRGTVI